MSVFHHTVKTVTPFHDRSRHSRLLKIALWVVGIAVVLVLCHLGGLDVLDWFQRLWDTMTGISIGYIVVGLSFQTIQTVLTAVSWYFILAAGYPNGGVRYRDILAAYAAGVAMNGFLPANIGTIVTLLMYVALIRGSTFAGVLGATLVQKIFYTAIGVFVYLYLFLSVPGTFNLQLGFIDNHRLLVPLLIVGAIVLVYLVVKKFWSKAEKLWDHAKQGGAILANKRDYVAQGAAPVVRLVACEARRDRRLPRRLQHPRDLPHDHVGGWRQLPRQLRVVHARRRRRHPGGEHRLAVECHEPGERSRLLARPADHRHRVELRLRARPRGLGVRLDRREAARGRVVHGRQGEGGGAVGRPQGAQGREEGGQAVGRRRLICSRGSVHPHRRRPQADPRHRVRRGPPRARSPQSKEPVVVAADYPFMDVLWSMMIFFLFVIWIWILITVFADIFRRRDIGGGMKAVWIIFVILLPYLGVFIYLIAEGHHMAERNAEQMNTARAQQDEYIKSVAGSSPADQIAQAKSLLDSGAITQAEFDGLKAKALA